MSAEIIQLVVIQEAPDSAAKQRCKDLGKVLAAS